MFNAFDSVEHSGGQRVRLDLQKLNQFSVFPGQVGMNFTQGASFIFSRMSLLYLI